MIHLNIRSSAANLDNFINCLECLNTQFAIICLTETWLNETNYDLYEIPNYVHIGKQRSGEKGGNIIVGVIYRPPGTDVNQFNDMTSDI